MIGRAPFPTAALRRAWKPALAAGSSLLLAGCPDHEPLPHTSPPGALDSRPVSAFGKTFHQRVAEAYERIPDMSALRSFDPARGRPVQVFADEAIGGRVAEFVAYRKVNGHWTRFLYFYPAPTSGPGPGLCRSRVYLANGSSDDEDNSPGFRGEWLPDVYSVAGSVAPMARPWPAGYEARLQAACAARRDMAFWFSASPGKAYAAARMADTIVASAQKRGLGFTLRCRAFPPRDSVKPLCAGRASKVVASINPRAIRTVSDCHDPPKLPCLAIGLSKFPSRASDAEGDLWTLNVHYRDSGELRIVTVDVDDTRIDFE